MPVIPLSSVTVFACATNDADASANAHPRITHLVRPTQTLYVEDDGGTLVRRMRLPWGWAAIVCVMALCRVAHAQVAGNEFGIERFRLSTDPGGVLDVDSAEVGAR